MTKQKRIITVLIAAVLISGLALSLFGCAGVVGSNLDDDSNNSSQILETVRLAAEPVAADPTGCNPKVISKMTDGSVNKYLIDAGYVKNTYVATLSEVDYIGLPIPLTETTTETFSTTNAIQQAVSSMVKVANSAGMKESVGIEAKTEASFLGAKGSLTVKSNLEWSYSISSELSTQKSTANTQTTAESYAKSQTINWSFLGTNTHSHGAYRIAVYGVCDVYVILTLSRDNQTILGWETAMCAREGAGNYKRRTEYSETGLWDNSPENGKDITFVDGFYKSWTPPVVGADEENAILNPSPKAVSAGYWHTLIIDNEGALWAWGSNANGKLGDGTTMSKNTPVRIKEGTKFIAVSAGDSHSLAIDEDNNLWAWGGNSHGQVGDGSSTQRTSPVPIRSGTKFIMVSAGNSHSMALDENNNLWVWGGNGHGQLGDGTTKTKTAPLQVKAGTKFKYISAGNARSFAIDENDDLWGWGNGDYGSLGNGGGTKTVPVQIKNGTKFKTVSVGGWHCIAVDKSGNLWAWGSNVNGKLGDGTTTNRNEPVQIMQGTKFVSAAAHDTHSLGIDENGALFAWGANANGSLGNNSTARQLSPVQITAGSTPIQFVFVSAGYRHSVVADSSGDIWAWGNNEYGQVGNGNNSQQIMPIKVLFE